jgi:MFS family permease
VNAKEWIGRAQAYATIFRRNARLYLLNSILAGLSFSVYSLFFNLYILARGYPKDFLGLLSSLPSAVALFAAVPLGLLSDRIGRRKAMLWGTLGAIVAIAVIVWGASPAVLIAAVILLGMSNELFNVSASPFMMENSGERERTALFSASFGFNTLAGFAGSLVGGQLPRFMSGTLSLTPDTAPAYGAALLISPALNVLAMLPLLWMREPPRPVQTSHGWAWPNVRLIGLFIEDVWTRVKAAPVIAWRGMIHRQVIVKLLLPNAIISIGAALLIPYMNVFFRERHHVPDETLGVIFALSSVVTGVATLAAPLLARRFGKVRSVALAQAASLPFLLTIGFAPSLALAAMAFWARGALMNMGGPLYSAFMMEQVAEGERATVNAFASVTWNVGWAICPYLSGVVQERWGFNPLFVATAALYGLASVLTYWFFAASEPSIGGTIRRVPDGVQGME